jgi:ribonucleoside-diphosphate reductase alpha chain
MQMHMEKYPDISRNIYEVYEAVYRKEVLPSMRSMQFAGKPIIRNPSRIYNCAYMPASDITFFSELMFLLLGGTGLGYSVQQRHVSQIPIVWGVDRTKRRKRYVVGDSIEGWADAIKVLVESYFQHKADVSFDYGDIRLKGTPLKTSGGLAPGAAPLREAIEHIRTILEEASGRQLTSLEVHDIACHIADAVLAGGIRRAAMICLFDKDDMAMLTCKAGTWYEQNPQRGRANNSVILLRGSIRKAEFLEIWNRVKLSGSGEPGIYWTNDLDWGTNPCCEIALKPFQFCNL